ncbi:hypothetical protein PFFCH_01297 [Plasmodium falciparum FCH/4]|uniref:Uncharacterized protein n=2 Tax=Plasmodium falciparum TaxID=5833 RepID=A0A024VS46_PLAFA|nr:hypothetical protein PFFCH_01297 [Plasmodium falciparum FCH/4]ETW49966.1 hypothetical protein PFMALIP_01999 [Plasmodium falciparum MaliPS096_E11]
MNPPSYCLQIKIVTNNKKKNVYDIYNFKIQYIEISNLKKITLCR